MMTYVLPNVDTDYRDMCFKSARLATDKKNDKGDEKGRREESAHALSNGSWFGVVTISSFFVLGLYPSHPHPLP